MTNTQLEQLKVLVEAPNSVKKLLSDAFRDDAREVMNHDPDVGLPSDPEMSAVFTALADILLDTDCLRQAIATAEAGEWQPIETAPKDGRWFLVRKSSDDFYPPIVVRWNAKISCFMGYNDLFEIRGYWGWFEIPRLPYSRPLPAPPAENTT